MYHSGRPDQDEDPHPAGRVQEAAVRHATEKPSFRAGQVGPGRRLLRRTPGWVEDDQEPEFSEGAGTIGVELLERDDVIDVVTVRPTRRAGSSRPDGDEPRPPNPTGAVTRRGTDPSGGHLRRDR